MIIREPLPALDERGQRRIVRSALENDCAVVITVDALFFKDPYQVRRPRAMLGLPVFYLPEARVSGGPPAGHTRHRPAPGSSPECLTDLVEKLS